VDAVRVIEESPSSSMVLPPHESRPLLLPCTLKRRSFPSISLQASLPAIGQFGAQIRFPLF
jgi:hypothetical protein